MAIDMTTVKAISYNNKDVVKIEDGQGNILWQKPPSWHTVWEGYLTIVAPSSATTNTSKLVYLGSKADVQGTQLRVTFSNINATGDYSVNYVTFGSSSSTKPTSPKEGTMNVGGYVDIYGILSALGASPYSSSVSYRVASLLYDVRDGYIYTYYRTDRGAGSASATLTITKIEWCY